MIEGKQKMEPDESRNSRRVILAVETRLFHEMLRHAIDRSPGLMVVSDVEAGSDLATQVERQDAQWVILSLSPEGELPEEAEILLAERPEVSVLGVAPDGSEVKLGWSQPRGGTIAKGDNGEPVELKWTEPHQEALTDPSLPELIQVLRTGLGEEIQQ
jgi:hypothetical protein